MRVLALHLEKPQPDSFTEAFFRFGHQIHTRPCSRNQKNHWLFIDITSSLHLFSGEASLLESAEKMASHFSSKTSSAIANTVFTAQAFAFSYQRFISTADKEKEELQKLPLTSLIALEGLEPWANGETIYKSISLFHLLGLKNFAELMSLKPAIFVDRWQEAGKLLWQRLHGKDRQTIPTLSFKNTITHKTTLSQPTHEASFLLYRIEKALDAYALRLQGQREHTHSLELRFFNDKNSGKSAFSLRIESSDTQAFPTIRDIETQISKFDLTQPIESFEVSHQPVVETTWKRLPLFQGTTQGKTILAS